MKLLLIFINNVIRVFINSVNKAQAIILFTIRLLMARIFFFSALTKIDNWDSTLSLFRDDYKVPFIDYKLAAYLSTFVELSCPILLLIGLGARISALPMFFMTLVINYVYPNFVEHNYWLILLMVVICFGPGRISLDYYIGKKYK